jgi:hypothetical protein
MVLFAWLAMPRAATASCGYYVVIGRPSAEANAQMNLQEQMPLVHKKLPCNGPQCKKHERPANPANLITVLSHDAMARTLTREDPAETSPRNSVDQFSFISNPHIWRVEPPPRA